MWCLEIDHILNICGRFCAGFVSYTKWPMSPVKDCIVWGCEVYYACDHQSIRGIWNGIGLILHLLQLQPYSISGIISIQTPLYMTSMSKILQCMKHKKASLLEPPLGVLQLTKYFKAWKWVFPPIPPIKNFSGQWLCKFSNFGETVNFQTQIFMFVPSVAMAKANVFQQNLIMMTKQIS